MSRPVLLLSRRDVRALMTRADYLHVAEQAFRASKEGRASCPPPMTIPAVGGGFHAKGASFTSEHAYVALKLNGNFPGNPERFGLPTIQGAIMLCDGHNGSPLAIMDSIEITLRRTAAASALASRHLARTGVDTLCIVGCGEQAGPHVAAIADVVTLKQGYAWDIDIPKAARFARGMGDALGIPFEVPASMHEATRCSGIIVTCTTSRSPFLDERDVSAGALVVAVGADWPGKSEIAPRLMASSAVVVDVLDQCLAGGDLHHAVAAGAMSATDVHADLGDIIVGNRNGRGSADEVVIFDSTGTAILDVASAVLLFERASTSVVVRQFDLADAGIQ